MTNAIVATHMTATLTLDKAGRVVIPKPLRDELRLGPGDALQMEVDGGCISLRPLRIVSPLLKERGVWVYRTGHRLPASTVDDTMQQVREERHRDALGQHR